MNCQWMCMKNWFEEREKVVGFGLDPVVDQSDTQFQVPVPPLREDYHPKRNEARMKMAKLPKNAFQGISSDIHYELGRRFPELEQKRMWTTVMHIVC